jgi:hypothetical protein
MNMKSPEKITYQQTMYVDVEDLKLEDFIDKLQMAKNEGWELNYNDFAICLTRYAEETDEQYNLRMARLDEAKNQRKQLYEELRKEFETE